jgi:hypothetical protein
MSISRNTIFIRNLTDMSYDKYICSKENVAKSNIYDVMELFNVIVAIAVRFK